MGKVYQTRSTEERPQADAFLNNLSVKFADGESERLGIKAVLAMMEDNNDLQANLIERAKENGGVLDVTLTAQIRVNTKTEADPTVYAERKLA